MHWLRHKAETKIRRLLRVLFLRLGALSASSSSARWRIGGCLLLCVTGDGQSTDQSGAGRVLFNPPLRARWRVKEPAYATHACLNRSKSTLAPMVNRVLTSPYLWWFDRSGAGPKILGQILRQIPRPLLKVLAFQTWQ